MTTFSQKDPVWAHRQLGSSGLSMEGYGCAVTSFVFEVNRFWSELKLNPGIVVDRLNADEGFTPDGSVYWAKIAKACGNKVRYTGTTLPKNKLFTLYRVLVGVNIGRRNEHWYAHFPAGVPGSGLVMDPLDGKIKTLKQPNWRDTGDRRYFVKT